MAQPTTRIGWLARVGMVLLRGVHSAKYAHHQRAAIRDIPDVGLWGRGVRFRVTHRGWRMDNSDLDERLAEVRAEAESQGLKFRVVRTSPAAIHYRTQAPRDVWRRFVITDAGVRPYEGSPAVTRAAKAVGAAMVIAVALTVLMLIALGLALSRSGL